MPEPGEIKAKKGNPGKRKLVTTPECLPELSSDVPDWLSEDAAQVWNTLIPDLKNLKFFRNTDVMAFSRYCEYFATWKNLKVKVDQKGETYETSSRHGDMQRLNPDFVAMLRIDDKLEHYEDRFGLSPAARQRVMLSMSNATGQLPVDPEEPVTTTTSPMSLLQQMSGTQTVN